MRLEAIRAAKTALSTSIQELSTHGITASWLDQFVLLRDEPYKRKLLRLLAPYVMRLKQRSIRKIISFEPQFDYDVVVIGERFGNDISKARLLRLIAKERISRVLIPGCFVATEDVQFWLRHGIKRLDGIDVYSFEEQWQNIAPQLQREFKAEVCFQQASIEKLPFDDGVFDLIASDAVLEHVRNLDAMVRETARVLRVGGLAWHRFGPLYYTWSGDHCIGAFGDVAGYDHILLDDDDYRSRVNDQTFFDKQTDPDCAFWARHEQFSFATAEEYLELFSRYFNIEHIVLKVSEEGLAFRGSHPEQWAQMRAAGLSASDLLVKSMNVILRKT